MAGPAQKTSTTQDFITGGDNTGPVGAVRMSRAANGLQISVDGAAPVAIEAGDGITSLTGDVTGTGPGATATTLANIPTTATMAGKVTATAIAAPSTPTAGHSAIYVDSTSKILSNKDDAGAVYQAFVAAAAVSHQFVTALPSTGTPTRAQPVTTDISGLVTNKAGTNLTDADQTIQPVTDKSSQYTQATTLTASRTKTLGVTSAVTGLLVRILRTDAAAFTLVIANGGTNAGTLFTFASTPTENQAASFFYNGTDWLLVGFEYVVVS